MEQFYVTVGIESLYEFLLAMVLILAGLACGIQCILYRNSARLIRCREWEFSPADLHQMEIIRNRWGWSAVACGLGLMGIYYIWAPICILILVGSFALDTWCVPSVYISALAQRHRDRY